MGTAWIEILPEYDKFYISITWIPHTVMYQLLKMLNIQEPITIHLATTFLDILVMNKPNYLTNLIQHPATFI